MKEIYQTRSNSETRITVLMASGLWDLFTIFERQEWIQNGKIYDSVAGKQLYQMILNS
jgi:hypothetical protein